MTKKQKIARNPVTPEANTQGLVFVSLLRTADTFTRGAEALVKTAGLTGAQYNILRVLRGAGEAGLGCSEIGCRLISRDPDITRLLDRMESRGLIARAREIKDRRVVKTRITPEGLRILRGLDEPVQQLHRKQLRRLPEKKLRQMLHLLEEARGHEEGCESPE
jgi:DNA-binding MarR family transcriptional regulator